MRVEVSLAGFSAAHFLIGHERCEHIHGHNWHVGVSVTGEKNERGMVIDFDVLKTFLLEICAKYDHKILLPGKNPYISLEFNDTSITLKYGERTYRFPPQDVLILPLENVTAEELADLILSEILGKLQGFPNVLEVEIWVEESPGKRASASKLLK